MGAGSKLSSCIAMAALALGVAPAASAAVTTVYKCFDRNMNVLYTDQPCSGQQLDIEVGRADPNAVAELQREREALNRAVAARIADNRRLPAAVGGAPDYAFVPPFAGPEVYSPAGLGYYAPYADNRLRGRGSHFGGGDNRARMPRNVPAVPPNGINNRTFR